MTAPANLGQAVQAHYEAKKREAEEAVKARREAEAARLERLRKLRGEDPELFGMLPGSVQSLVPAEGGPDQGAAA